MRQKNEKAAEKLEKKPRRIYIRTLRGARIRSSDSEWIRLRKRGMMQYEAVIGLEVHVQVRTESKMFCSCANRFGAEPNTLVCPVCMGYPGVLPVPNHEEVG